MEQILEGGTEEPAYVGEPAKQEEVKIASEQGVTVEDDGKIEVKDSKEETVVPEPTFEPVETVPPVVPDDKVAQAMEKTQVLTPVKENETTKIVNELSEKVDDKTIELQLPEEDKDLYDQINKELDATPSSLKLTSKEAISLLVNKPQDLALIGKYNYLGLEPEAFRTIIQDEYGNPVPKEDGSPKTFLDYLEENQEDLAKINFNEKIYLRGEDGAYMDGKTFARERLFDNAVHGYRSVATIIENYIEQPGKKKIFGLF